MWLILSTLPHYLSIVPLIGSAVPIEYTHIIVMSSTLSILYHLTHESDRLIRFLDHVAALVWFGYDVYLGNRMIIDANIISFMIHCMVPMRYYEQYHGIWHLINAAKCYYVSASLRDIYNLKK
jgi:hypothetical protein